MATRNASTPILRLDLITCKVGANPATEKAAGFRNVCTCTGVPTPARMGTLKCPVCDQPPSRKAREVSKGVFVLLDEADLEAAAAEAAKHKGVIDLNVHRAEELTDVLPAAEGKVYVLHPYDGIAAKNYALILGKVRDHPELFFTSEWSVSTAAARYRLQEFKGRLVLVELARAEAIRELPVIPDVPISAADEQMVEAFLQTKITPYDPAAYRDTGRELIEAAVAAGTPVTAAGAPVVAADDLMAQLQAAVAAATVTPISAAPSKRKRAPRKAAAKVVAKAGP